MLSKISNLINGFRKWWNPEPISETSDVVEVKLLRKRKDGSLVEFSLSGENASLWGFLVGKTGMKEKFESLLPCWKKVDNPSNLENVARSMIVQCSRFRSIKTFGNDYGRGCFGCDMFTKKLCPSRKFLEERGENKAWEL
jgi:hypothetical protein